VAVFDLPRSGRPPILTTEEALHLAELLQTEPRQLKQVYTQLTLETVNKFSLKCLKDALRKLNFAYQRCRRSLKEKRDKAKFLQTKGQLTQFQAVERQG
jgi:transposase